MITVPLINWQPIADMPEDRKDGRWLLLAGGKIDYGWEYEATKPPCVVGQWLAHNPCFEDEPGRWQFAWYDGGYYGEYEAPTHWADINPPEEA